MGTIKLDAPKKLLYARIGKKRKKEQGGEWLFSADYPDKYKFVGKLYKKFKNLPADIRIDTTGVTPARVYRAALLRLERISSLFSRAKSTIMKVIMSSNVPKSVIRLAMFNMGP
jgi:hypothetical protein